MPRLRIKRYAVHKEAGVLSSRNSERRRLKRGGPQSDPDPNGQSSSDPVAPQQSTIIVEALQNAYKKEGKPADAASMSKYMRNHFTFYGLKCPQRRDIDKQILSTYKSFDQSLLISLATELWQKEQREFQYFAVDLICKKVKVFSGSNSRHFKEASSCLLSMLTSKSWWDTIDPLASVVGDLVLKHGSVATDLMEEWIHSDNMWLRRTVLLHQLKYREKTDSSRLFRFCLDCAHEEEFFIRKAIGWALRQYHRVDPSAVERFVRRNGDKLSTLSKKEALRLM